jgi:hypothetical protein
MSIAKTIQEQIGHKAFYMMGAKNLLDHGDALSFRIRGSKAVNYIKITLNAMDTYDLEFGKVWGMNYKVKSTFEGAYVDMLHDLIESKTGLYLKLF